MSSIEPWKNELTEDGEIVPPELAAPINKGDAPLDSTNSESPEWVNISSPFK
jgi:hypothetical protein